MVSSIFFLSFSRRRIQKCPIFNLLGNQRTFKFDVAILSNCVAPVNDCILRELERRKLFNKNSARIPYSSNYLNTSPLWPCIDKI